MRKTCHFSMGWDLSLAGSVSATYSSIVDPALRGRLGRLLSVNYVARGKSLQHCVNYCNCEAFAIMGAHHSCLESPRCTHPMPRARR